jgi:hypothetical protein
MLAEVAGWSGQHPPNALLHTRGGWAIGRQGNVCGEREQAVVVVRVCVCVLLAFSRIKGCRRLVECIHGVMDRIAAAVVATRHRRRAVIICMVRRGHGQAGCRSVRYVCASARTWPGAGENKKHVFSSGGQENTQKNMFYGCTPHCRYKLKNIRCTSPKPSEKNSLQASFCPSKPSKTPFNHRGSHQNVLFVGKKTLRQKFSTTLDTTTTIEPHHHEEVFSDVVFSPPHALRDFLGGFDGSGMFYGP